jgi:crotonobetainyl-CoA:carnitine CoA-transferase CaiB-like acyl-CoA transferase
MPAFPVAFSQTPADLRRHPPLLGEHSVEILKEAGLDQAAIDAMLKDGDTVQAGQAAE